MTVLTGRTGGLSPASIRGERQTPCSFVDYESLAARARQCQQAAAARGVTLAYSVKTNPDPQVLAIMRQAGLGAEAINMAEVGAALAAGFDAGSIVLCGLARKWPDGKIIDGLSVLISDTADDLCESATSRYNCVRLRLAQSRMGEDITTEDEARRVAGALTGASDQGYRVGIALHQHHVTVPTFDDWLATIGSLVTCLEEALPGSAAVIECLDLGGGYEPDCLDAILHGSQGRRLLDWVRTALPACQHIVLEPGKSLVQAAGFVLSEVLAHRYDENEVTVDASMAELPWPSHARPIFVWREESWHPLRPGTGRIAGRTTAETDILGTDRDISELHEGDYVLFAEAGAYDISMRSVFGAGRL